MQELQERDYRPPFITETDEVAWDDCTVCATLMASAVATMGETVTGQDWRPLNRAELKILRERIRNHLPADKQTGATSMADMRFAFAKEYPWLPDRIPFYDEQDNTWEEFIDNLKERRYVYVVMGNPALVDNVNSNLRRWTNNDNFGHAITALEARVRDGKTEVYIMDPLGRGEYDGEWVPAWELKQFTWTFGNYVKVNGFPRGGWDRVQRTTATLIQRLRRVQEDLSDSEKTVANIQSRLATVQTALDAARITAAKAVEAKEAAEQAVVEAAAAMQVVLSERNALTAQIEALQSDNDELTAQVEEAEKEVSDMKATCDALNAQVQTLEVTVAELENQNAALIAERDGALERAAIEQQKAADAEAALATANKTIATKDETLKKRWRTIQNLRKELENCEPTEGTGGTP